MKKKQVAIISTAVLFVPLLMSQMRAEEAGSGYQERFGILTEKNIFSRTRWVHKTVDIPVEAKEPVIVPKKYSSYILIGISSINDSWKAFFENLITGDCKIVNSGDIFEGGTVLDIDADGVKYQRGEEEIELVIGSDMKGETEVDPNVVSPVLPESTGTESEIPAGSSDLLKRMMERRNQQLK